MCASIRASGNALARVRQVQYKHTISHTAVCDGGRRAGFRPRSHSRVVTHFVANIQLTQLSVTVRSCNGPLGRRCLPAVTMLVRAFFRAHSRATRACVVRATDQLQHIVARGAAAARAQTRNRRGRCFRESAVPCPVSVTVYDLRL